MTQHSRRYDRIAGDYSQYRPRYPDRLVAHLAGIIGTAPIVSGGSLVLDVGSGTGAVTRRLRAAGVVERFGSEGAREALRDLAAPHRIDDGHVRFGYLFQCITVRRDP